MSVQNETSVFLVTSARRGEGVSTVARKLARSFSRNRSEAILVDCNLLPSAEFESREKERFQGLTEVIEDSLSVKSVVRVDMRDRLSFLPAGRGTSSPIKAIASGQFQASIQYLREKYDWIILDGPPVSTCPESTELARIADIVILVVRAEDTRAEVIEQTKRTLERTGTKIAGAILNRRRYYIPPFIYKHLT